MLLQEQKTESLSLPNLKLAQENVTGDNAPQLVSEAFAGLGNHAYGTERGNQEVVTEELLAEVREMRLKADQETVMTKRKGKIKDRTAWVFLGGMVAAGAIALVLVYTNYVLYLKFMEMSNDVMQRNQAVARKHALMVLPEYQVKAWTFPGAQQHSLSTGSAMATATMTAKESYASVWKYYAQETGYNKTFYRQPAAVPVSKSAPDLSANWTTTENGLQVTYKIESHGSGGHPIAYFTEHDGPNMVTVVVTPGAGKNVTDITIYAMNAE